MLNKEIKFIEKAKQVHGDKYDYSLVKWNTSLNSKVDIICKKHGVFSQRPNGHLKGYKCKQCFYENQKTGTDKFIEKAKQVHGDKYDYSLVKYITNNNKIKIICKQHGVFEQTPINHLRGKCELCSFLERRIGTDKFIEKAKQVHGDKYDYSKCNYKKAIIKIKIICKQHGVFEQTPHNHLKGQGCFNCVESVGENNIRKLLNENKINFIYQHRFKNCRIKLPLPFDFYLPEKNMCIEFNGIQHYKPIQYFGGEQGLKRNKKSDYMKLNFCKKNKIKLIIIKYNERINNLLKKIKNNEI